MTPQSNAQRRIERRIQSVSSPPESCRNPGETADKTSAPQRSDDRAQTGIAPAKARSSLAGLGEDDADLEQQTAAKPLLCSSNCQCDIAIFAQVKKPGPLELLQI